MKKILFICFLAVVLGFSTFAHADNVYSISGSVKDSSTNLGINGATVVVKNGATNSDVVTLSTNVAGFYTTTVTAGDYYIKVTKEGYEEFTQLDPPFSITDASPSITYNVALWSVGATPATGTLSLSAGWNFISFPKEPADASIEKVLADISPNIRIIWGFDNITKQWKRYKPSVSDNKLSSIESGKGYWIYMNSPGTIGMTGWGTPPARVKFYEGWNLSGYAGTETDVLLLLNNSFSGKWDIIWGWNNSAWSAKHSTSTLPVATLTSLNQSKAYWIKIKKGQTAIYAHTGSNAVCTVGSGIGCTAEERAGLQYGGQNGCSDGTQVTLNPESNAPGNQQVCGLSTTDSAGKLYVFKGIQYADSPEGNNRWVDPLPPQWNTLRAVEYGPVCPQGSSSAILTPTINEDCLYLNVWTPKLTSDGSGNLPVMVFIHGGAFISGSGGSAKGDMSGNLNLYDGTQFVTTSRQGGENIVFVTLNYRLGALGFMAGNKFGLNGNFGIKDQTKALEWVQRNIALFGGDPKRVMIFGESAGAQSTALHLTITDNNHQSLFGNAVMESGYAVPYMPIALAQSKADAFARGTECNKAGTDADVLACLRGISVPWILNKQLLHAYSAESIICAGLQAILPWNPVIDHTFITQDPIKATISKPIMNGSNLNESIPFIDWVPDNDIEATVIYIALTDFLFDPVRAKIMRDKYLIQYPLKGGKARLEQVVTDYLWTCFNRKLTTITSADSYRYHDIHHPSFPFWANADGQATTGVPLACAQSGEVCHADELPFVFGNPTNAQSVQQTFTSDEANMSSALRNYWIAFARSSNPNVTGQAQWPKDSTKQVLQIQAPASAIQTVTDASLADDTHANCNIIWDIIGYTVKSEFTCF